MKNTKKILGIVLALVVLTLVMSISVFAADDTYNNPIYVNCDYNSTTEGWGVTHFSNYAGAYAYATVNNKTATIVVEKTNTLSGNTFDNNHKNYSSLAVVIKDGATMGNALSKWDMTYPVTVEPGGTLTCARPANASVSNIHIKNTLTVGAKGSEKKAVVDFLSDTYQDCDISIRYNGKILVYNADFKVQDLDAQGTLTIEDSDVYVDGAFASATFFATTLTDSTMTVKGNQISGGLSDFAGGTSNQLGNVKITNSTLTIEEGTTKVAANVTVTNSALSVNDLTVNNGKKVNLDDASTLAAESVTLNGTASVTQGENAQPLYAAKVGTSAYATLEKAFAAAVEGDTIVLLADATPTLTSQKAITKAAVIDLGGKTLTLTEDDLYFGTTTFQNGTIVVDPSVKPSTAVFWMFANQTLTFDGVQVVATGVTGTYLIGLDGDNSDLNLLNGSEILVENTEALDLDIICVNASTGNDIVINNSNVNVTNLDGRVFFRGNYTVSGTSEIALAGITKAGFRIEAGQTLSIEDTAKVTIAGEPRDGGIHLTDLTATYTKADTATVSATVAEPFAAAVVNGVKYATLQAAIDAVKDGETVTLLASCDETITFTQTKDVSFVIDGNNNTFTGTINIVARAGKDAPSTLVIKNINFTTDETTHDFIKSVEKNYYPNNITISNCTFEGTGADSAVVPITLKSANNIVITDCKATKVHSLLQNTAGWNITVQNCEVTEAGRGMAMGSVQGLLVKNVKIEASNEKYGIRIDAEYNNNAVIENCDISAFIPVVVRKATADSSITFNGTNTMTAANTEGLWCAIGIEEYGDVNKDNLTLPSGKVVVTLNDTGLNKSGMYGHYVEPPKADKFSYGFVKEVGGFVRVWGEAYGCNASESFVIELYCGDKLIATTKLNNIGNIIDGDIAEITWNFFYPESNDAYWTTTWEEAQPNSAEQPDKVVLYVDGVKVAENEVQMNGPDSINQVKWRELGGVAVADLEGEGTAENPYLVTNLDELKWFRDDVNAGNTYDNQFVKLTANIDLNNEAWTPIGNATTKFLGTFDGQNNTISNLYVDVDTNNAGLFGFASVIKNLKIENANVSGIVCVGALVGELESSVGTLDNCHVSGKIQITGENSVGGLAGKGYANIKNCSVIGDGTATSFVMGVYGTTEEGDNIGGIIGHLGEGNTLGIANSKTENIKIVGTRKVGGIVGTTARANDYIGNSVNNIVVESTATKEYADANAATTTIGGIIGNYFGSATSGGILKDSSVSNVEFIVGNAKGAGSLAGGDRVNNGGAPVGIEATGNNIEYATVTGTTNYYLTGVVAEVNGVKYTSFADALAAASAMTGDVVVEILDKVTLNTGLTGSYDSIKFVGKTATAEIYLDVQGYITATGKNVAFEGLTLSKSAGGFITNAGFMNVAFGIYDVKEVTYTNCTFANGAYASSGNVTFTGCTFYRSHDKYGLWAYGNVDATVDDCTFADYRGIKMYAEGAAKTVDLTVKNTDFSAVTDKPAIVLTYGESVTLEGNTYSDTGVFELDKDGAPNGTTVTSTDKITCVNDDGVCGVLVDGKIYTTLAQAAEVAKTGSTVTLLHSTDEAVELEKGVTLKENGFTAANATFKQYLFGSGTEADPYRIENLKDLIWFRDNVDKCAIDGSTQYAGKYILLTADIDLAGINWDPIGTMSGDHGSFQGVFDGGDHTISNLNVQQAGNGIGLFARTTGNAVIKNLKLNNVTVKSTNNSNYVGGLVGNAYASTYIENVHVTGTVDISGRGYIGGIAGHGYVKMDNVSVVGTGTIYSTFWCAGGILGYAGEGATDIKNAHVEGITITSAAGGLGAIVGMAEDNNGTQPISGSNLSAKNVEIKTYTGAYGNSYANYALGYLYGGNSTSKLTGELKVENVDVTTSTGEKPTLVDIIATNGDNFYYSLQEAINANGDKVVLNRDTTESITVPAGKKFTLDLGGNTLNGTILAPDAELTVENGSIVNNNSGASALEINAGTLIINNVEISSARHALRIDGAVEATINGGKFFLLSTITGTRHALNISGAATVTINGGTFIGPKGIPTADSGSAVCVQTGAKVTINGGSFSGGKNATIGVSGTAVISGGTYDQDVSAFCKDGYVAFANGDGTYTVALAAAKVNDTYYKTVADAFAAAQNDDTVEILVAGTYNVPTGKNITITGAVDGVKFDMSKAVGVNASMTFNNVTFEYGNANYVGLQHAGSMVYNNCTINGQVSLYGASEIFNNCTFNQTSSGAYNVWTYGAKYVEFNNCTFNSAGKSVLVYSEDKTLVNNVSFANTTFKASASVDGKAAIEIDTSLTAGANITIDEATTATGFDAGNVSGNSLWNNKKGSNTDANNDLTVVVGGQTVLAPVTFVAKIGNIGYTSFADAIKAANPGETVTILAGNYTTDIDVNKAITVVGEGTVNITGRVSVSSGATVKNLNVNNTKTGDYDCALVVNGKDIVIDGVKLTGYNAMRYCYANGDITIKNSTINGSNFAVHFDGSAGANIAFENCDITGWCSYASTVNSVSYTNCKLDNGNYEGHRYYNKNISFTECDFADGMKIDLRTSGTNVAITDSNMTIDEAKALFTDPYYVAKGNVTLNNQKVTYVAYTRIDNKNTYFSTLQEAINAANEGGTVFLSSNVVADATITINKPLTLDLFGYTITGTGSVYRPIKVVGDDSDIAVTITGGTIETKDLTTKPTQAACILVYDGADVTLENVTLNGSNYGVLLAGSGYENVANNQSSVVLNKGTVITTDNAAILSQGAYPNTSVEINDGATVTSNGIAIYQPCVGEVVVNGGSITGATAIYMKAGNLTVNGGAIAANGEKADYEFDSSGAKVTGDAIVIESCDYGVSGAPTASIVGGTITSVNASAVASYAGNGVTDRVTGFVSGGKFNGSFDEDLLVEGGAFKNVNGTYSIVKAHFKSGAYAQENASKPREFFAIGIYNIYAENSLEIKVYDQNGNLMVTARYRDYDLDDLDTYRYPLNVPDHISSTYVVSGKEAGSWSNVWEDGMKTVAHIPTTFEVYADGELCDTWTEGFAEAKPGNPSNYEVYCGFDAIAKTAKIGDIYYATLAEAIAAIGAGDVVIELLSDATLDYNARDAYGLAETTSVTINGNGHTLTLNQKNSDWSSIGLANADGKLVLKDMTINKTGYGATGGAWNTHAIIITSNVEMNDVTVNNSVAVQKGATLNNVTINEANGYYGLWINANGQSVTMNGGAINATNGGRGIKIADQYVGDVASVTLNITGTKFETAKKAAVLVSSTKGATITAENVDITKVAEDSTNLVWIDEDWSANYGEVTVTGGTASQESVEDFNIIVKDGDKVVSYFKTLDELFDNVSAYAKVSNVTVELVGDVVATKVVKTSSLKTYNFVTNVAEGVTMDLQYADNWNYFRKVNIGENITVKAKYLVFSTETTIAGTVDAYYPYINGGKVTVAETGTLKYAGGDALQVKGNGAVLTVYGTVIAPTINVWAGNAQLIISGANAKVESNWIDIWDGAPTVTVENGATLTTDAIKVSRGGSITVDSATLDAGSIEVGHNSESAGKLVEKGDSTINGEIKLTANGSTVASDGGLNVTTNIADHKVVYDAENSVYKVVPCEYVAQVGETKYESLQEALEAAKNEENIVIELLADATLDITAWQTLAIGGDTTKTITINGNSNTLTFNKLNSDWNHVATNNDAKLVLNDMTITDSGNNNGPWNRYDIVFACDVELNNVTSTKALAFKADATLKTVTITEEKDAYAIWIQPNGQTIAINGLVVNSAGRGIKIDNQYVDAQATTLDIANATFTTAKKAAILVKSDAKTTINVGANVDISGVAADRNNIAWTDEDAAANYGKVTVTGGTLAQESIEKFVASVIVSDKVEGYYKTLAEAFAAVNGTTATVQVLADIATDSAITIANGTTVTLDLNGKTITGTDNATGSFGLITNRGNLTITGNGKITLTATNDRDWNAYSSVISNTVGGKLVVENGTIEHLGGTDMAYAIDNLTNGKGTYAETVVNGGTVKSTYRAIRQFLNGVEAQNILTINGGTIEGANKSVWFQDPSKNANSGTLTIGENASLYGDVYLYVTEGSTEWPVSVSIAAAALKDGASVISANVPYGYVVEEVNGTYGVRKANYVAKVNGVQYETLADAFAAAQAGDTVKLVYDVILTENAYMPNGIYFNGNGYHIEGKLYATNGVTFVGDTSVYNLQISGANAVVTIAEGASVTITGGHKLDLNNGVTINVVGGLTDAKNTDKSTVKSSFTSTAGIKFSGNGGATFNVTNAYVKPCAFIGYVGNGTGTFAINVTNSIVDFSTQVSLYNNENLTDGEKHSFALSFKDCIIDVNSWYNLSTENSNVEFDNCEVSLNTLRNTGVLTLKNGTTLTTSMFAFGNQGGNNGTINVDNSTLVINTNETKPMDGLNTGKLVLTNNANVDIDYITSTAIVLDPTCKLTTSGLTDTTITVNAKGFVGADRVVVYTDPSVLENVTITVNDALYEITEEGLLIILKVVAQIGDVKYPTLQDAINAAKAGETITLLADVNENVTITKSITLDGANFKYTGTMTANAGLTVTVQNVNFVNGGFDKSTKSTSGTYTIKNCTFDGAGSYAYPIRLKGTNSLIVEDCTVKNYLYSFLYISSGSNNVSVKNVTVENCPNYAVYFASGVNNAMFENLTVKNSNNGFIINNTANRAFTIKNCKMENVGTAINHTGGTKAITCTVLGVNDFGGAATSEYANYVLAAADAKLVAPEGLNVTTSVEGSIVKYVDGVYKVFAAVVKIDETYYGSLQEAIDAANDGDTIVICQDYKMVWDGVKFEGNYAAIAVVEGKSITIDLNGKNIELNTDDVTATLIAAIATTNGGSVTLKATNGGSIVATGEKKMYSLLLAYESGAYMTIEGGNYSLENASNCLVYAGGNQLITVKGGNFHLGNVGTGTNGSPWIFNVEGAGEQHVIVTGGTYNADIFNQYWRFEVQTPYDDGKYYTTVYNKDAEGNETWTVKEAEAVVLVPEGSFLYPVGYETLAEAIAAAKAGQTVQLVKDIELTSGIVIGADKDIVLDLNGKTLSYTSNVAGEDMIVVKGSLTIDDSTEAKAGKITYANTDTTGSNVTVSTISAEAGSTVVINNGTIENKTVKQDGSSIYSYAIDMLTNGSNGDVSVTINGGTVCSDYMAIRQFNNGDACKNTLVVNGGYIYGKNRAIQVHFKNNAAYTTITGGKIEAKDYSLCLLTTSENISVTGGEFIGDVWYSGTTGFISGGTFDRAVYEEYCAEGYIPTSYVDDEGNTIYTVKEGKYVAQVGDTKYESLAEAINAGGTVVLLADVVLEDALTVNGTVVLDLAGYTISQEKAQTAAYSMIVVKGDLTIKDSVGNGKISYKDTTVYTSDVNYVSNTIINNGKLTIESGIIENASDATVADFGYPHAIDNNGALVISGGTISNAEYTAIRVWCTTDDNTSVVVNGGVISGVNSIDMHNVNGKANKGTLTVNGGELSKIRFLGFGADVDEITISITGGKIDELVVRNYVGADEAVLAEVYNVSGGTFKTAVPEAYCANGYVPVANADGTYGVVECELFKYAGTNLKIDTDLSVNFWYDIKNFNGTDYYAAITKHHEDTCICKGTNNGEDVFYYVPYSDWDIRNNYAVVIANGIAAKEMTCDIFVTIYKGTLDEEGKPVDGSYAVSETAVDSIVRTINRSITDKEGNVNLVAGKELTYMLYADLLNYGKEAQMYFKHYMTKEDENGVAVPVYATNAYPSFDALMDYATETPEFSNKDYETDGAGNVLDKFECFAGSTLVLENTIHYNIFLNGLTDVGAFKIEYTFTHNNEVTHFFTTDRTVTEGPNGVEVQYIDVVYSGNYVKLSITDLAPADLRNSVDIKVYTGENAEELALSSAISLSVEGHCARAIANGTSYESLYNSIMRLAETAKQNFKK